MRVNGKQKNITLEDMLAAGKSMGLRKAEMQEALEAVRDSLSQWRLFAEQAEINASEAKRVEKQFDYL